MVADSLFHRRREQILFNSAIRAIVYMYASPKVIIFATVFLSSNEKLDGSSFSVLGRNERIP